MIRVPALSLPRRIRVWRRVAEAHLAARGLARPLFGRALVHPGHFARVGATADGLDINGPSLLRVPDWAPRRAHPEARYYLYFAHHRGRYLRLAWAPALEGPWTLFNVGRARAPGWRGRGVFDLDPIPQDRLRIEDGLQIGAPRPEGLHVASPDAHVDHEARRFVIYAHMPVLGGPRTQMSFAFTSEDGLGFEPAGGCFAPLGPAYFRVFFVEGRAFAVTRGGWLHRASTPGWGFGAPWVRGPRLLEVPPDAARFADGPRREGAVARHLAVESRDHRLTLYFSRVGDTPERILAADVPLEGDWTTWRAGSPYEVHCARAAWEGAKARLQPSAGGVASGGVNELRDPYVFVDDSGLRTLLYCVQGERAIAARTLGQRGSVT